MAREPKPKPDPGPKLDPVERAIKARERAIERMEASKKDVLLRAELECQAIDKRIAERRALLDALKAGKIQP